MMYFILQMSLNLLWVWWFDFEKGAVLVCFGITCAIHVALSLSALGTGAWDKFWSPTWVAVVSVLVCWYVA